MNSDDDDDEFSVVRAIMLSGTMIDHEQSAEAVNEKTRNCDTGRKVLVGNILSHL